MAESENLPVIFVTQQLVVVTDTRVSIVGRGLAAVRKANDALYRKARTTYNLITDDGRDRWIGEWPSLKNVPLEMTLENAFATFQQLAKEGYGKAYLPLSNLYSGEQSVKGDKKLELLFAKLAFEWCFAKRLQDDPEIWNDLGHIYVSQDCEQALHWFRKAAEQDHPGALFNLSYMYEYGCGVEQSDLQAFRWKIRAAEQGNLAAILDLISELEDPNIANDESALYWYRKAAEQGYPWTEADFGADKFFILGTRYIDKFDGGNTHPKNLYQARKFLLAAANLDHAEAQYKLAALLVQNGNDGDAEEYWLKRSADLGFGPAQCQYAAYPFVTEGEADALIASAFDWYLEQSEGGYAVWQYEYATLLLPDSPQEGLRWLKASAQQDYRPACARLGHEYLRAKVSEHTTRQGIFWLSHAVELGDTLACESLADLYLLGRDGGINLRPDDRVPLRRVEPDKKAAIAWYERAIELGSGATAYTLGHHYLTGEYIDQDLGLAEKWLRHSAFKENTSAQMLLGEEYESGARFKQDSLDAINWFTEAAETSLSAGLKLAEIYFEGKTVPKNFDLGLRWLTSAAEGGIFRNGAMRIVAQKCFDGRFSAADESTAQTWLLQMAANAVQAASDPKDSFANGSARHLAELYELGLGVAQDMGKAIHWYKQAADRGSHPARTRLLELGLDWRKS